MLSRCIPPAFKFTCSRCIELERSIVALHKPEAYATLRAGICWDTGRGKIRRARDHPGLRPPLRGRGIDAWNCVRKFGYFWALYLLVTWIGLPPRPAGLRKK